MNFILNTAGTKYHVWTGKATECGYSIQRGTLYDSPPPVKPCALCFAGQSRHSAGQRERRRREALGK